MAAYQQNKLIHQFSIKFYTETEFDNLKEPLLKLPDIDYEKQLQTNNAIGRVCYNNLENGIFIYWDEIKPNTMSSSLGYNILVHDDTSQAIFLSLIRYLQSQFKQEIIFDESFALARIDVLDYSKCKKIISPVIMKAHQNKNIKRIYGGIVVPLVNYIVLLKPKIDITLLNNFYNIDEECLPQDTGASSMQKTNLTSFIQQQLLQQSKIDLDETSFVEKVLENEKSKVDEDGGASNNDTYSDASDKDDSQDDDDDISPCKNLSKSNPQYNVIEDRNATVIGNVPIAPKKPCPNKDNTDSNCGCYVCNKSGIRRRKRRKHNTANKTKKQFNFDKCGSDDDNTTTTSYYVTSSDNEKSAPEEPKYKKFKSTSSSSLYSRSTMSKFNAKFKTLAIDDNSIIAHLTELYNNYLDPLNTSFDLKQLNTDFDVFEVMFEKYKNKNNILEEDLNNAMFEIFKSYVPEQTPENFEQLLSSARINGKDGILMLYSYIKHYAPRSY